jgi:hypothetical protein
VAQRKCEKEKEERKKAGILESRAKRREGIPSLMHHYIASHMLWHSMNINVGHLQIQVEQLLAH